MDYRLQILRQSRQGFITLMDDLTEAQLLQVPTGFNNNIIWNFGHSIVVQHLLIYALSGLPVPMDAALVEKYRRGTKGDEQTSSSEMAALRALAFSSINQLESDLAADIFKTYKEFTTGLGVVLTSAQEAITFNNSHEGLHLGYAMAIRKLVEGRG